MWCWRPAQIIPPQDTYEVMVMALRKKSSESVDFRLLLYQPKLNWSVAAVEADNDIATYDMEAQCGAGGQPRSYLCRTHTRLW